MRLAIQGASHRNPDGEVIPCPHLHVRYSESNGQLPERQAQSGAFPGSIRSGAAVHQDVRFTFAGILLSVRCQTNDPENAKITETIHGPAATVALVTVTTPEPSVDEFIDSRPIADYLPSQKAA
jgi:hypothetical protein